MNYECQFGELDARDSDLQSLPDAPNASKGETSMLSAAVCGLVVLIFAVGGVVSAVRWVLQSVSHYLQ